MDQQNKVTEYFGQNPAGYAKEYDQETPEGYSFRVRRERLLELLGSSTDKILDIGCGPAVMTKEVVNLGWDYTGIDISDKMIEEAKQKFPNNPRVKFEIGSVEKINSPDNNYAAIIAMGLVEYLEDDVQAIVEMRRVLRPGGKLLVSLPNWWSPMRMWDRCLFAPISRFIKKLFGRESKKFYQKEFRPGQYRKLLIRNGFKPVKTIAYNFRLLPKPLDLWLPSLSVRLSKIFEWLHRTPLWFLGTGVIIEAQKIDQHKI